MSNTGLSLLALQDESRLRLVQTKSRKALTISGAFGNRPSRCFENIRTPSAATSNAPLLPLINSGCTPSCPEISAARLEARGR